MRIPTTALLALAVAACGSDSGAGNFASNQAGGRQLPAANATASAQATGARIAALPEAQRNATFYRAIHDAGMDCQQVVASAAGGTYHGMPVWNATCRGGGHWTLVVGNDETVQILNANEARLVTDSAPGNAASR